MTAVSELGNQWGRTPASARLRGYIGIDGGGTRTRALFADQTGCVRGVGHAGSANRNHHARDVVRGNLRQAIHEALGDGDFPLSTVFLGLGGVSTDDDRQDIVSIIREIPEIGPDTQVVVENDTMIALTGGLAGRPGVVLIAGTGSVCYGNDGQGKQWLCGGWGALADDIGSASWVGLRALQAAVQAEDGRADVPTALRDIVFDFLALTEPRQFISRIHNQGLERAELGRLAPRVVAAACQGDPAAEAILRDAAAGLAKMVSVTVRRLFGDASCEMVLAGGLALSGPPFQPMLTEKIMALVPGARLCEPALSPVQGAVLEALRADGIPWKVPLMTNLGACAHPPAAAGLR